MYKQVEGILLDPNDPNDASKVPKTANDLRFKAVSLELRQLKLQELTKARRVLRHYEDTLIMSPNIEYCPASHYIDTKGVMRGFETREEIHQKIAHMRHVIILAKFNIKCEALEPVCKGNNDIPIFSNYCNECLGQNVADKLHNNVLKFDLLTIRNLKVAVDYYSHQISASLSNQLDERTLMDAIKQSRVLTTAVLK